MLSAYWNVFVLDFIGGVLLVRNKQNKKENHAVFLNEKQFYWSVFSVLNNKWKEKSQLISQLEQQVREMKDSWEKKELKLSQERDKALHAAK